MVLRWFFRERISHVFEGKNVAGKISLDRHIHALIIVLEALISLLKADTNANVVSQIYMA